MHVSSSYLKMIIYIYVNAEDARSNLTTNGGATGFLLGVEPEDSDDLKLYAVTNAHVLEELEKKGALSCAIRINTLDEKTDIIETELKNWMRHPEGHDVAIYRLTPKDSWQYSYVSDGMLLRESFVRTNIFEEQRTKEIEVYDELDNERTKSWKQIAKVGIGTETIMVGRFMKHGGTLRNYPL